MNAKANPRESSISLRLVEASRVDDSSREGEGNIGYSRETGALIIRRVITLRWNRKSSTRGTEVIDCGCRSKCNF